jgi:hypothetical protein
MDKTEALPMSTAPTPSPYNNTASLFPAPVVSRGQELNPIPIASTGLAVLRRPTFAQGRGLEILGHAIEYLVDSRMYLIDEPHTAADTEATRILMSLSRQIFQECAEVVSSTQRLRMWFAERFRATSN